MKLYYNRARYYNPDLGRFISRDPIDIADDVNLYAYVGNNGVMFVDRMGMQKKIIANYYRNKFAEEFRIEFVGAYDEYLRLEKVYNTADKELKNALYNLLYYWTYKYFKKSKREAYNKFIVQEEIIKEMHYNRNRYNIIEVNGINDATNNWWSEPEYLWLTYLWSFFHQNFNVYWFERKFVSPDWDKEVIYYKDWTIVNNIKYVWTYNIYSPIDEPDLHKKYDVDTYLKWGN